MNAAEEQVLTDSAKVVALDDRVRTEAQINKHLNAVIAEAIRDLDRVSKMTFKERLLFLINPSYIDKVMR